MTAERATRMAQLNPSSTASECDTRPGAGGLGETRAATLFASLDFLLF